jgi:pyruvate,water dikinase
MIDFKSIFKRFSKASQTMPAKLSSTEAFRAKYHAFQRLLEKNNHVLELMADMEEKLSGEYLFDRHYLDSNVPLITAGVLEIIKNLNAISQDRYKQLYDSHANITREIQEILIRKLKIPVTGFTIAIDNLVGDMQGIAGGKMAHLSEVKTMLNFSVPEGFSITAYAYKIFIAHNNLAERINDRLSTISLSDLQELNAVSREIQEMILNAEVPEEIEDAIRNEVEKLRFTVHRSLFTVSVRSSAILEDGELSFAGQYSTFLNVPLDSIIQKYKEVVASLFTPRAIFYCKTKGFSEDEMVMPVGILEMVDSKTGGVMYTKDPNDPDKNTVIINAVWGLGKPVVDGTLEPDYYIVDKKTSAILDKKVSIQETMTICHPEGDIKEVATPDEIKDMPCLSDDQIKALTEYANELEKYYGAPQDIEWAIDKSNQIYILQSRQLRMLKIEEKLKIPRKIEKYNILLDRGVIACKGIGYGRAFVLKDEEELKDFPDKAVLIARHTSTKFVTVMNKASAIVTDIGGATGHMASLSREYQVPTIVDTQNATTVIKNGQEITVDAINCNIYEGHVKELLDYSAKKTEPFKNTHLFKTLQELLKYIVPLNLVDPQADNFKPEMCMTLHDITRFAHEKAMNEMFSIGEGYDINKSGAIVLKAGIPIDAVMMDIDGGIKENVKKASAEDILSIPFSAFLKGMLSMRWPEPRPADAKGFFHMMATTASIPEDQLRQAGKKSFAIVSRNYMNFSIRLGYHFSQVEAYAGEKMNDNYIRFFFKGGGASPDRKLRRVRLIKEILRSMDISVSTKEDVINAVLTGYNRAIIEEKLTIIGKLTAYTKQLDMVMYNDAVTDWYIEEFVKEHLRYE